MTTTILSMNLKGRFRPYETRPLGQAILQRLLRQTDIFFGHEAQFQPCLPGNFQMVGNPSAFIIYNCQLYSAMMIHNWQCPFYDSWKELPSCDWIISRVFCEQSSQEVLAISWFTDDAIQSKKKREVLARRLFCLVRDLSSSFGLPAIIGGSFHLSKEEVDLLIKDAGLEEFRCYGYWLDSMRRSVRASDLFICTTPRIELNQVRPRSLSGNICIGCINDTWRNPEDSFYWDPLSAKMTIKAGSSRGRLLQFSRSFSAPYVNSGTDDTENRQKTSSRRINYDVIRTTLSDPEASTRTKSADHYHQSPIVSVGLPPALTPSLTRDITSCGAPAISHNMMQDEPNKGKSAYLAASGRAVSKLRSSKVIPSKSISRESNEMVELREILSRLKVGREVQIGPMEVVDDCEETDKQLSQFAPLKRSKNENEYILDDLELTCGKFSRKLSTISESCESTCSSSPEDISKVEETEWSQNESLAVFQKTKPWKEGSLDETTDGSMEGKDSGICSTRMPSNQSSQDERIVEGSSDVDQDDKTTLHNSQGHFVDVSSRHLHEAKKIRQDTFENTETSSSETARNITGTRSSVSDLFEEDRLESNFICHLM